MDDWKNLKWPKCWQSEHLEVQTIAVAEAESGGLSDGTIEENRGNFLAKCSAVAEAKSLKAFDDEDRQRQNSLEKTAKIFD